MHFPFFRRKNKQKLDELVDDPIAKNLEEMKISEEKILIEKIGKEKIKSLCDRYFIEEDFFSLHFLKLIDSSPLLLDNLMNNYYSTEIFNKINDNKLQLSDINSFQLDLLQFPIFDEKNEEKAKVLRKEIILQDKNYASIDVDVIKNEYLPTNLDIQTIPSYLPDINLKISEKKVMAISVNKVSYEDKIVIISPINDKQIIVKNFFDSYLEGSIKLNEDTIIVIPWEKFINLTDEQIDLLRQCKVLLKEDFNKFNKLNQEFFSKDEISMFHKWNKSEDEQLIKLNHLLYVLNNCSLNEKRKKYYSYYFKDYYHNIEKKDYHNFYYSTELDKLILDFFNELDKNEANEISNNFNELSLEEKKKDIDKAKFSAEIFLENISDLEKIPLNHLIKTINKFEPEIKKKIFNDERIQNKFKKSILEDSKNDYWGYFRGLFNYLEVEDLFSVINQETLKIFLNKNSSSYILFAAACENDLNKTIEMTLKNDYLFNEFFKRNSSFYSSFYDLDYSLLTQIIYKMEENNWLHPNNFIGFVSEKDQYKLLKEPFKDETLVWMIKSFKPEVQSFFFQNDNRALYLASKFNMPFIVINGIKVHSDIIESEEFFEKLKHPSLIQFRNNINKVENTNPSLFLEERVKKYYNGMIEKYQKDSDLFKEYQDILENPNLLNGNADIDYIFTVDVLSKLDRMRNYDYENNSETFGDKKEAVYQFLKSETSKKLSEIIVDYLFQDNIYNVWLNIKEMLRYNKILDDSNKVLDSEKEEFYNAILNIDKIDNINKINLYKKFKDKNISLMFYQDLRNLKDLAYKNMNKDIIKLDNHPEYIDKEQTVKYGVNVYDLRDKEYTMLVRCMGQYREQSNYRRNCYTLLSNENNDIFNDHSYTYGYCNVDADCILHVFESDSYSMDTNYKDSVDAGSNRVNRIMTSEQIVKGSKFYSEIQIVNKKNPNNQIFDALRPDFLLVFDEVTEEVVNESKRLGIPIAIAKKQYLDNKDILKEIDYNYELDNYLDSHIHEDKYRKNR
ncbi:MAG: hypothetical protein IJ509_01590 [Bacilli bacterium]|nr:hypothetical protein [Bacilli bacterium]